MPLPQMLKIFGSVTALLLLGFSLVQADVPPKPPMKCSLALTYVPDAPGASHGYVYVLERPGQAAAVFAVFDSAPMQEALASMPRGSVLEYPGLGRATSAYHPPTSQENEAFGEFCKQHGFILIVGPT